jgi:hypothetical protein
MAQQPTTVGDQYFLKSLSDPNINTNAYVNGFIDIHSVEPSLGLPSINTYTVPNHVYYFPAITIDSFYRNSRKFTNYNNTLTLNNNSIGIGTASPNEKLTIVGNISAKGRIYASEQPYTWYYPGSSIYPNVTNNHLEGSTFSVIGGGAVNVAYNSYDSVIAGGFGNNANNSRGGVIGGGCINTSSGNYTTVAGGKYNLASAIGSSVVGGYGNSTLTDASFVGGGYNNTVSGYYGVSVIVGGLRNLIAADSSAILGGDNNVVLSGYSNIIGGNSNTNSGYYSTILGGTSNYNYKDNVFIAGSNITAPESNYTYVNNLSSQGYVKTTQLNTVSAHVYDSAIIDKNLTIFGNLSTLGTTTYVNTNYTTTSAISVVNFGVGPAIYAQQVNGNYDIAAFVSQYNVYVLDIKNAPYGGLGKIGVNTNTPNVELTVNGSISSNQVIYDLNGNSNQWNQTYTFVSTNSANILQVDTFVNQQSALISSFSGLTGNLNSVYGTVSSLSSNWQTSYSYITSNSALFYQIDTFIETNSANILEVDSLVNSNSAYWNTAYTTLTANSGFWNASVSAVSLFVSNSANIFQVDTFVNQNSANILQVDTLVNQNSGNWQSGFSTLQQLTGSTTYAKASSLAYVLIDSLSSIIPNRGTNYNIGNYSTIGGGQNNSLSANCAFIGGGSGNINSGAHSVILGGKTNTVNAACAGIIGGKNNTIQSIHTNSFIVGSNITSNQSDTLFTNNISVSGSLTVNGTRVLTTFPYLPLSGGEITNDLIVDGNETVYGVLSSFNSHINSLSTSDIEGYGNEVVMSDGISLSGNGENTLSLNFTNGVYASNDLYVGGKIYGDISNATGFPTLTSTPNVYTSGTGTNSIIPVSGSNNASGSYSNVAGGYGNTASGYYSTVAGGSSNQAQGVCSNISGGFNNITSGILSHISGGKNNNASGSCSNILGGINNNATGTNTFILGSNLDTPLANYTYVNNLSSQGNIKVAGDLSSLGSINASNITVVGDISATGNVYGSNNLTNTFNSLLTATTYTIQLSDSGSTIVSTNVTTGLTATVNGSLNYPVGFQLNVIQLSSSSILFNSINGSTIHNANGAFKTTKQYSAATLIYTGSQVGWVLFGDLTN